MVQNRVPPGFVPRHPFWRGRRPPPAVPGKPRVRPAPRIGRDTRPPSPRRLTGAGRLRRLFAVCEARQRVTRLASLLNHAEGGTSPRVGVHWYLSVPDRPVRTLRPERDVACLFDLRGRAEPTEMRPPRRPSGSPDMQRTACSLIAAFSLAAYPCPAVPASGGPVPPAAAAPSAARAIDPGKAGGRDEAEKGGAPRKALPILDRGGQEKGLKDVVAEGKANLQENPEAPRRDRERTRVENDRRAHPEEARRGGGKKAWTSS